MNVIGHYFHFLDLDVRHIRSFLEQPFHFFNLFWAIKDFFPVLGHENLDGN
ncbi:hypothetical protein G134_1069 [Lactobacillus delbrueckii subsp. lactis CRL581]|nr:hypothetical protein G134_1069 [Lactobacillus delbrueckii subsp. lactis CRL581]